MKIKRSAGILCHSRYDVNTYILRNFSYALILPRLIYGIVFRGNTQQTALQTHHCIAKEGFMYYNFF